jgi:protocatechuate 3,4-dioxygenase beta subunit
MRFSSAVIAAATVLLGVVRAHSEGQLLVDVAEHHEFARRALAEPQCKGRMNDPALLARREEKHQKFVAEHLQARGYSAARASTLARRSAASLQPRATCVLSPELSIGPYFVQKEQIRNSIAENQKGIPFALDIQFFNIADCSPLKELYVDIWHCNSTGVYSGVKGMNTVGQTFYRGVVKSDADGIAHITSNMPGWYDGRALHVHVVVHYGGNVTAQNTYQGGRISHIGQLFFPEATLKELDKADIYKENKAKRMTNNQDQWYTQTKATGEIALSYVGTGLKSGVIGKATVAVDLTRNNELCDADSNNQQCWTGPVKQVPYKG